MLILNVFSFSFRMYPVVIGNGRNLQSDAVIAGYHVPKGVYINFSCYVEKWLVHCIIFVQLVEMAGEKNNNFNLILSFSMFPIFSDHRTKKYNNKSNNIDTCHFSTFSCIEFG